MPSKGNVIAHVVTAAEAGSRLDRIVAGMEGTGSRRRAREAIDSGKVDVDDRTVGPGEAGWSMRAGARVAVHWSRPGTSHDRATARRGIADAALSILHEDADIIVLDKPPGLLTDTASRHQALERDSLTQRVRRYLRAQGDTLHVVHRIDRDTSGIVLIARNPSAESRLKDQFMRHEPERMYLAFVQGVVTSPDGTWQDWMAWDGKGLIQRSAKPEAEGAVLASAHYHVSRVFGDRGSLLEVRLVTGRRNQIRLHLQLHGHPLFGEKLYLPRRFNDPHAPIRRQALHAARLGIVHPGTGKEIVFDAPLPDDLARIREWLDRGSPPSGAGRGGGAG